MTTQLDANIELANEAIAYAFRYVSYSTNKSIEPPFTLPQAVEELALVRNSTFTDKQSLKELFSVPEIHLQPQMHNLWRYLKSKKNNPDKKAGNCTELASLAAEYLDKHGVEYDVVLTPGHMALMIGRTGKISDLDNLGREAVVIDAWATQNKVYQATRENIVANLKCFDNEKICTFDFDPTIHHLEIYYSTKIDDSKKKDQAIQSAIIKLDILMNVVSTINPVEQPLFSQIQKDLSVTINSLVNNISSLIEDDATQVQVEKFLNTVIHSFLNSLLELAEVANIKQMILQTLIAEWRFMMKQKGNLETVELYNNFMFFYCSTPIILCYLNEIKKSLTELCFGLLPQLSGIELNALNIFQHAAVYRDEDYYLAIIDIFSGLLLDDFDKPLNHFLLKPYENDDISLLHILAMKNWEHAFVAFVNVLTEGHRRVVAGARLSTNKTLADIMDGKFSQATVDLVVPLLFLDRAISAKKTDTTLIKGESLAAVNDEKSNTLSLTVAPHASLFTNNLSASPRNDENKAGMSCSVASNSEKLSCRIL